MRRPACDMHADTWDRNKYGEGAGYQEARQKAPQGQVKSCNGAARGPMEASKMPGAESRSVPRVLGTPKVL